MITIVKRPQRFTPSGNPVIWQVQTDNANILYFKVEVIDNASGATINFLDIYPTPDLQNGAFIDLSRLLDNAVNWQVSNDITKFVEGMSKPVRGYRVKIEEKVLSGTTVVTGATYNDTADVNYVFAATFEHIAFNYFEHSEYVIKNDNLGVKFLTFKPDGGLMNKASTEYLYFMADTSGLQVKMSYYNKDGSLNNYFFRPISGNEKMYRLNISYKALRNEFSTSLTDGMSVSFQIVDSNQNAKTEERKYIFKEAECHLEMVNILFVNSLGGVDAYQFVNPTESMNVTRTTMKKNPYRIVNGKYENITNDVYNVTNEVLNSVSQLTVKAHTRVLKDKEVFWLGELVTAKQWFIELSDMKLVPVMLVNNSYNYQRQKYLKGSLNVMTFDFQFAEGFIPTLSFGDASYIVQTSFRNKETSKVFYSTNCGPDHNPVPYVYTVPAGMFTSEISQTDADWQAIDYRDQQGPIEATNANVCTPKTKYWNVPQSGTFYKSCPAGQEDATGTFWIIHQNTYWSYDSVDAANAIAYAALQSEGQAQAESQGTCTVITQYGNDAQSGTFYSQNCGPNSTPEPYVYTVPANTYFASTKGEANSLALGAVSANGQFEADSNGLCTFNPTPITLYVQQRWQQFGSTYYLYYTVYSSAPVTDNISINVRGDHPTQGAFLVPGTSIYAGSMSSNEEYGGQWEYNPQDPNGWQNIDPMDINVYIWGVSPNPDSAGTTYDY
jgi:hypothetical protein